MIYLGKSPVGLNHRKKSFDVFTTCACLYQTFYQIDLPEVFVIDFEGKYPTKNDNALIETFRYCTGVKDLTIKNLIMPNDGLATAWMFADTVDLVTVRFVNCVIKPTRSTRMFCNNSVKHIYGPIDMSLAYGNNTGNVSDAFYFCRYLEDIEFVPNTIKQPISTSGMGYGSYLNDGSLISFGNALDPSSPNTQSLNSNSYLTRIQNIMGNNQNGLFVADNNGAMSLYDFMTNIKGWTITA